MPAYSQSTIRIREPSSMKFAVRRSLWHGRSGTGPRARSTSAASSRARSNAAGTAIPCAAAVAAYASTTRKGSNRAGIGGPPWIARSACATRRSGSGSRIASGTTIVALDEARDEIALGLDERDHLRPDADGGRREGRLVLRAPVDPEQLRVAAADPEHVDAPVDGDLEVAIRDPAAERLDPGVAAGPDPLDHLLDPRHVERS